MTHIIQSELLTDDHLKEAGRIIILAGQNSVFPAVIAAKIIGAKDRSIRFVSDPEDPIEIAFVLGQISAECKGTDKIDACIRDTGMLGKLGISEWKIKRSSDPAKKKPGITQTRKKKAVSTQIVKQSKEEEIMPPPVVEKPKRSRKKTDSFLELIKECGVDPEMEGHIRNAVSKSDVALVYDMQLRFELPGDERAEIIYEKTKDRFDELKKALSAK